MKYILFMICLILSGCANLHFKSTFIEVSTPGDVTFGDVRTENLSENVSPTLRGTIVEKH